MTEDCLLCGARQPISHVLVRTELGERAGRMCATHTFKEVIFDRNDRFFVSVTMDDHSDAGEPVELIG